MSLISTASPWISDDSQRKRTPTMRKTIKKTPQPSSSSINSLEEPEEYTSQEGNWSVGRMPTTTNFEGGRATGEVWKSTQNFQDTNTAYNGQLTGTIDTTNRQERVNNLVNHINALSIDNDGNNLADFKPLSHPVVSSKKPESGKEMEMIQPPVYFPTVENNRMNAPSVPQPSFSANNIHNDKNSDYRSVYQPPSKIPVYGGYGNTVSNLPKNDDRLMDRINYMIHLLEEQANEKTNNVLEEFVMFSLVGVFLIYVLDSFSRSGRYTR
jgi:hypothetical protein